MGGGRMEDDESVDVITAADAPTPISGIMRWDGSSWVPTEALSSFLREMPRYTFGAPSVVVVSETITPSLDWLPSVQWTEVPNPVEVAAANLARRGFEIARESGIYLDLLGLTVAHRPELWLPAGTQRGPRSMGEWLDEARGCCELEFDLEFDESYELGEDDEDFDFAPEACWRCDSSLASNDVGLCANCHEVLTA